MDEIVLTVITDDEDGGYVARWDDPAGGGITTQGDTLAELQAMVADAVHAYFDENPPKSVRLHFEEDPVLAIE